MSARQPKQARGFTLVEVMVVMVIFSMIGLASYQIVDTMINTETHSGERQKKIERLQYAMLIMERDIRQIVARPIRGDEQGANTQRYLMTDPNVSDSDADTLGFVRTGWPNPGDMLPRSALQPVVYRLQERQLQRISYPYVDQVGADPDVEVLLENVEDLEFGFIANRTNSAPNWQPTWERDNWLPIAIQVLITTDDFGTIERVFAINGGPVTDARGNTRSSNDNGGDNDTN